jgi:hypothetical protein
MGGRAALTQCWSPTPPPGTKESGADIVPNTTIALLSVGEVVVTHAAAYSMGCGWDAVPYTTHPTL